MTLSSTLVIPDANNIKQEAQYSQLTFRSVNHYAMFAEAVWATGGWAE